MSSDAGTDGECDPLPVEKRWIGHETEPLRVYREWGRHFRLTSTSGVDANDSKNKPSDSR